MRYRNPGRHRLGLSLLLSAFLHLLLVVGYHLLAPSPALDHLPFFRPPQTPSAPRLSGPEPEDQSPAMKRMAGRLPDLSLAVDAVTSAVSDSVAPRGAPGDTLAGPVEVGGRHRPFEPWLPAEDSVEVQAQDLGPSFPMEERDAYARLWLPDADTTDVDSAPARRARQIVLACLNAMGGVDRLKALRSMSAVVWVRATTRWDGKLPPYVHRVPAYYHPVAVWRFDPGSGQPWERRPYNREGGLPSLTAMVPYHELGAYSRFFEARWMLHTPPWTRSFRNRSEGERWNFVERFLGEGIHLRYLGRHTLDGRPVHSVRVDDRKFGRIFAAHFDADDALLAAVDEEVSEREAEWFVNQWGNQKKASPAWTTRFEEYEEVQGVLYPTKWRRSGGATEPPLPSGAPPKPPYSTILLNVAFNGEEPSQAPPEVE